MGIQKNIPPKLHSAVQSKVILSFEILNYLESKWKKQSSLCVGMSR